MAWRIADSVTKGEIDNRTRDQVTGRIWLHGREDPVLLELTGNPHRDLAGQRLCFTNPKPQPLPARMQHFAAEQTGVAGDITAARRVKVLEVEDHELEHDDTNKTPMPYHWGNCLYIEWHSARNGRVVIEATDYELTVEPGASWQMTEAEEAKQLQANGRAMGNFMETMLEAAAAANEWESADDDGFADHDQLPFPEADTRYLEAPQSRAEAEAEAEAARMNLLDDRVMARFEQEQGEVDAEAYRQIVQEERERLRVERGEPDSQKNWLNERDREYVEVEEWNARAAEAFAREDEPIDDEEAHSLVARCQSLGHDLWETIEAKGWLPEGAQEEHPLRALVHAVWFAGAKLAGALHNGPYSWPPDTLVAGNAVVRLKKAREYLKDAIRALDAAMMERLCPSNWSSAQQESIRALLVEVTRLIREGRHLLREAEEGPEHH